MTLFITVNPENDYFWKNHPTYEKARRNEDTGLDIPMESRKLYRLVLNHIKLI